MPNFIAIDLSDVSTKDEVALTTTSSPMESPLIHGRGFDNAVYYDDKIDSYQITTADGQTSTDVTEIVDVENRQNGIVTSYPGDNKKTLGSDDTGTKLYGRRWWVMILFCLYSFSNAFQWIHLNIVADIVGGYYNESLPKDEFQRNTAIDWLSIIYMVVYIPLIFPATWLLDKKGLRLSCICGSLLNALGAWLKCASVSPDRFALLMFAQTICAIAQIWVLNIPPRLAAVWFGLNEVSTATSLGVFGNQLGVAVGFLLPPIIVPASNHTDVTGRGFYAMSFGNAGFATAIFILIVIFFSDRPHLPPSTAQQFAIKAAANENYRKSLVNLFTNFGFVVLVIAYGINTGSYYAISTLLNTMVLNYFPKQTETAGRVGLTIVLTGILASVLAGIWLDKTKTFKGTTVAIYVLTIVSTVAFHFTLDLNTIWIVFLTAGLLGFFMTGYLPVGFEFAAELTFPESEGTSSGLLNTSAMIFGTILTMGMRAMLESVSVLSAKITICAFLLAGGFITAIIKPDYRRQEAGRRRIEEITNQQLEVATSETEEQAVIQQKSNH